ncbi:hypothetical protein PFISCL1PPCAC_21844, partial [Pristionchus fissidentatus]
RPMHVRSETGSTEGLTFPILALPSEIILKILRHLSKEEINAMRMSNRLDELTATEKFLKVSIKTTEAGSELKCDYGRPEDEWSVRCSMKSLLERVDNLGKQLKYGKLNLQFDRPNPHNGELVSAFASHHISSHTSHTSYVQVTYQASKSRMHV